MSCFLCGRHNEHGTLFRYFFNIFRLNPFLATFFQFLGEGWGYVVVMVTDHFMSARRHFPQSRISSPSSTGLRHRHEALSRLSACASQMPARHSPLACPEPRRATRHSCPALLALDRNLATGGYNAFCLLLRNSMRVTIHALHEVDVVQAFAVLEGGVHGFHRDAAIGKFRMARGA
jgi:hypothetical protein